ncbi:glutamate receptor U1-like [Tropilaelaps mercedesae]|uniref:Glutamate receptor U1-like n=1 Tax=Tropilaelaps mercedesae TaxID=418985 RepID=A0A1V9XVF7_9ACAR|nr:glutamate receptor U1-like [Tropilaelaps mercedesae]
MSWRNQTVRFTNVGWYPYVDVNRDDLGHKTLTGLTGHMLHFIVSSMGMKYDVVFPNDRQWGSFLPNGSWTGMIGDLTRNDADIAVGPFVMTEDEAAVAIPSLPYADEDLVILSGVDKEHESNVYGYITTMDYQVWLLLLGSCLFIMGIVGVMDLHINPYMTRRQRRYRFWRIFWVYWAAIFLEGSAIQFYSHPHRILLASWLLGTMVIMHMFIGYMESTLMVKSETFRINNVDELLSLPKVEPMIYEIGGYRSIFENAESYTFKMVMQQVRMHGGTAYGDEMFMPNSLRRVLRKKAVVLMEPISLFTRVGPQCGYFKGEGLFHIGKQRLLQIKMVFYMRKQLDRRIQAEIQKRRLQKSLVCYVLCALLLRVRLIIDSGIFRHWHDTLVIDKGACWTAEHSDHMHDYEDLHYSDLASIFYFYFTALYIAFNVLLIEILYRKGYCCCKYYPHDEAAEEEEKLLISDRMRRDGASHFIPNGWFKGINEFPSPDTTEGYVADVVNPSPYFGQHHQSAQRDNANGNSNNNQRRLITSHEAQHMPPFFDDTKIPEQSHREQGRPAQFVPLTTEERFHTNLTSSWRNPDPRMLYISRGTLTAKEDNKKQIYTSFGSGQSESKKLFIQVEPLVLSKK